MFQEPLEAEIHTKVFTMFGNITRAHKNSTEWKLAERQLHIKNAKNYRGITVTPTLSKIIEKILKIRENVYVGLLAFLMFSSTVVRAELASDLPFSLIFCSGF
jgi:hypothetical protein